jgi:hypothetical protein
MYDLHLIFSLAFWLMLVVIYAHSRCASIFHPITYYLFFHGLVFVIRPFFQYYLELNSVYNLYRFWPDADVKHTTLFIANLGLLSFYVGASLTGNIQMRFWDQSRLDRQNRFGRRLVEALILSLPLIIISLRYALSANFGETNLVNLARDASTFHTIYTDTTGYIVDANVMLGAFGSAIAWAFRFRLLALAPLLSFVALRLTVGWSRYTFVMACAGAGLLYLFDKRKLWPTRSMVSLAIIGFLGFSALSEQRSLIADLIKGESRSSQPRAEKKNFFDALDFANLEFVEYIVNVVPEQTKTYNYFSNSLEVFTAPIPRILWPEKPVGPPVVFFNLNDYGFPIGNTATLVGEGWRSLGFAGVAIWCLFGGLLWGKIYAIFLSRGENSFAVLYYCILLPLSVQWFRDGILLSLIKFPLFFMLPIVLAQFISLFGRRHTQSIQSLRSTQ